MACCVLFNIHKQLCMPQPEPEPELEPEEVGEEPEDAVGEGRGDEREGFAVRRRLVEDHF